MKKANKIMDNMIMIIAVIIFPMWLLRLMKFQEIVKRGVINGN